MHTDRTELQREGHTISAKKGWVHLADALQPNGGEEGQCPRADEGHTHAADLAPTIDSLGEFTVQLLGMIRAKNRLANQAGGVVRRALGFYAGDDESTRASINARVDRIVKPTVLGDGAVHDDDLDLVEAISHQLLVWRGMALPAVMQIEQLKKRISDLAKELPIADFPKSVKGLTGLGVGLIVGMAGDLSKYPKKGHLRKRLGVAPFDKDGTVKACSTWRREGGLNAEDWTDAGYKPERRSVLFAYIEDPLIKTNGDGPYRTEYLRRKEVERAKAAAGGLTVAPSAKIPAARKREFMSDGHVERCARRNMVQMLLRDLWRAWRQAMGAMPERAIVILPAAEPIARKAKVDVSKDQGPFADRATP
jgi:hypothetical protein